MRLKTLALMTAAGSLAWSAAALAGPLGGGALGGGAAGGLGGAIGVGHGGPVGGVGGALGGGLGVGGSLPGGPLVGPMGAPIGGRVGAGASGLGHGALGGRIGSPLSAGGALNGSAHGSLRGPGVNGSASTGAAASADGGRPMVRTGALAGLTTGMTVTDPRGEVLGTVDDIYAKSDGTVTSVLMTSAAGGHRLIQLAPETLRMARGSVTTSQSMGVLARAGRMAPTRASATGVAHSSANAGLRTGANTVSAGELTSAAASGSASAPRVHVGRHVARATSRAEAAPGRITREAARAGRMATTRASATGMAHANGNAGLRTTAGSASALAALSTGMTVRTASGQTLGTVERVERSASGTVRTVLVKTESRGRRVLRLAPSSLSLSGGVVTTTSAAATAHG